MTRHITISIPDESHAALKLIAGRRRMGIEAAATTAIEAWIDLGGSTEAAACRALMASVEDCQRVIADFVTSVLTADG